MRAHRLSVVLLASAFGAVLATSACDSGASRPRIRSFTATPENIPSLGGDVLLTWDVRNASEVEIQPLVGVVTGTAASVHVTETTTFTIVAKKKGRFAHKRATVTVSGPSTVVGVVRRAMSRDPVANLVVWIKGHGSTHTAPDGTFAFEDVETPYDIAVVDPEAIASIVYLGVTRTDPNLEVDEPSFAGFVAPVSGNITPALPVGSQNVVVMDSPTYLPQGSTQPDAYSTSGSWLTTPVSDFAIHAYRYTVDTAGNPASFTGYGRVALTLTSGIAAVQDIALTPITGTDETTGTAMAAGGATVDGLSGFLILGEPTGTFADEGFVLPFDSSAMSGPDGTFSLLSPALSGELAAANLYGRFAITGVAGFASAYVPLTPGASEVDLSFPAPPRLLTPISGGSISRDTVLRASTRSDSLKIYRLDNNLFFGPVVIVITTEDSFVIPDLREIGYDLFLEPEIDWSLYIEVAPRSSIDEALGPDGLSGISPEWYGTAFSHSLYSTEAAP